MVQKYSNMFNNISINNLYKYIIFPTH